MPESEADSFLMSREWQLLRQPPLLKAVNPASSVSDIWTVSGGFSDNVPFSNTTELIGRSGSVLLVQTSQSVSAVSVFDQRILWTRRQQNTPMVMPTEDPLRQRIFSELQPEQRMYVNPAGRNAVQVCGSSNRWICIQSASQLEIVDLLTGSRRWSIESIRGKRMMAACGDRVFLLNPETDTVSAFQIEDGASTATTVSASDLRNTLVAVGDELVVLRPSAEHETARTIEWISTSSEARSEAAHLSDPPATESSVPRRANVIRQVRLQDATQFQMTDPMTLISSGRKEISVIDLKTGSRRDFRIPAEIQGAPEDAAENVPSDDNGASLMVYSDAHFLYLFRNSERHQKPVPRFPGRDLIPVSGTLTALSRTTGSTAWSVDTGSGMLASFDQPYCPVLLLIRLDSPGPNGGRLPGIFGQAGSPRMEFRGILKSSGRILFDHQLTARYPVPFIRMITGNDDRVDIEAFGSRIRFTPE
jgi:hypothetical protein